jgi:predicted nucleic acid-binding protein
MIPVNDIWIAAIALETGLPVLARDEHFSRVRGLSVVQC